MPALRALLALSVAWLAVTGLAGAQPRSDVERRALVLFQEGRAAHEEGDLERARTLFAESLAVHEHPSTLLSLAVTCEQLGRLSEAIAHLERYVATEPPSAERYRRRLQRLRERPRPVRVTSVPPGARVRVDGAREPLGTTPLAVPLAPGQHVLQLELDGHEPASTTIVVGPDGAAEREVRLAARAARLGVRGAPSARIELDGARQPARADLTLAPGAHRLSVRGAAGTTELVFEAAPGSRFEVAVRERPPPRAPAPRPAAPAAAGGPRGRLELDLGPVVTLDVLGREVPASIEARLSGELALACERTCLALGGALEASPAGSTERDGSSAWLVSLLASARVAQHLAPRLALFLRASAGVSLLAGVADGDRLAWFPNGAVVDAGPLASPVLGLDAGVSWRVHRSVTLVLTAAGFRHVIAQGGFEVLRTGLTRLALLAGAMLTL